jgi:cytochrome c-type biogenesis protein CcmE
MGDASDGTEPADTGPDLSPRIPSTVAAASPARKKKGLGAAVVLALILAGIGVLLFQGLSNATVFFCNADEVGVRSDCHVNQRFRLQGTVDQGSINRTYDGNVLHFTVTYNGATVPVTYQGQPEGIFQAGIPVVVEGRMTATGFAGDRVLVKHTEQYIEKHPGRVPTTTTPQP